MFASFPFARAEEQTVSDLAIGAKSITTGLDASKPDQIVVARWTMNPKRGPQKGIASADIVYEIDSMTAGFTRYTAVFNDEIPKTIEAVRSTRIVNIDFYLDYGGCFIHYGGQQDPGSSIYDYVKTVDMQVRYDGISDSKNFYRDSSRSAPNNVICQFQQIYDSVDWTKTTAKCPLTFSDAEYTTGKEKASKFGIAYNDSYNPSYEYNESDGLLLPLLQRQGV